MYNRFSPIRSVELAAFYARMDSIDAIRREQELPPKLDKFARMYVAGLPLDATVRYFPKSDLDGIRARVKELTTGKEKKEVWIGVALPRDVERTQVMQTLIREINSLADLGDRQHIIEEWPAGSWVKVFYETPRQMDCVTVSLSIDPIRDTQEAEVNFWSGYHDLRIAMSSPPDWRLVARPENNFSWKFMDSGYPTLQHAQVLRRVFGHAGRRRQGMTQLANLENASPVVFEFKILPDDEFFIDYEVGPARGADRRASSNKYRYDWFYYLNR